MKNKTKKIIPIFIGVPVIIVVILLTLNYDSGFYSSEREMLEAVDRMAELTDDLRYATSEDEVNQLLYEAIMDPKTLQMCASLYEDTATAKFDPTSSQDRKQLEDYMKKQKMAVDLFCHYTGDQWMLLVDDSILP